MDVMVSKLDAERTAHVDLYRSIRLRALASDPDAFGSDLARESTFGEVDWHVRVAGFQGRPGAVFVARPSALLQLSATAGAAVGVVGIGESAPLEGRRDATLWGMWVAPAARGHGVSTKLVDGARLWAADGGFETITLWVHRSNDAAIRFYERIGFELQTDVGAGAPEACAGELRMISYAAAP